MHDFFARHFGHDVVISSKDSWARTHRTFSLVVIDPHPTVLLGIRVLTQTNKDLDLVGVATTAAQGLEVIETTQPDLVLTEMNLPDMNCADLISQIGALSKPAHVVIFSENSARTSVRALAGTGARGYIDKRSDVSAVVRALVLVGNGFVCLPEGGSPHVSSQRLSAREMEVIQILLDGSSNREAASRLHIHEKTVSHYKRSALKKLGVPTLAMIVGTDMNQW
ncbi:response regulator [Uliginosibacterium sp. sgz301328]|uniref:response regulator n=1 Tax=Uliginosibacterium sp. sgz301328 TaxID=3243764 RepID=UPI00359E0610